MTFGEFLDNEFYCNNYRYSEAAASFGLDNSAIYNWCHNVSFPNGEHCRDLDEFFDKPCGYFEKLKEKFQ